jgi:secreted trypsin-like serine protease
MICAGNMERDACIKDSGGPLVCNDQILCGIVNYGFPKCEQPSKEGIYAKVEKFKDWIEYNSYNDISYGILTTKASILSFLVPFTITLVMLN